MSNRQSPRWDGDRRSDDRMRDVSGMPNNRSGNGYRESRDRHDSYSDNGSYNNWNNNPRDTGWRPNERDRRPADYGDRMNNSGHAGRDYNNYSSSHSSRSGPREYHSGGSGRSPSHYGNDQGRGFSHGNQQHNVPWGAQAQPPSASNWSAPSPAAAPAASTTNWGPAAQQPTERAGWETTPPRPPSSSNWSSSSQPARTSPPQSSGWNSPATQTPAVSGWNAPNVGTASSIGNLAMPPRPPSSCNWESSSQPTRTSPQQGSGWDSPATQTPVVSGWDAPIVRTASSVDDIPPKKVVTRETEIEELFGSGLHPISSSGINFDKYDSIPVDLQGSHAASPIESFTQLPLNEQLLKNIERARYSRPTPIQKYSIPIISGKRDLMACAQTGSGKTAAFLIPAVNAILSGSIAPLPESEMSRRTAYPRVVILSPTRELALQTHLEARKFCFDTDCSCVVVYGGQDLRIQARDLAFGCDIVVATAGRLTDFLEKNRISLKNVRLLVIDEADRMLDMGFEPQIRRIVEQSDMISSSCGRQTVMFSATYPKSIQRLACQFLQDNLLLTVGRVGSTSDSIHQILHYAEDHTKRDVLLQWIPKIKGLAVVFVATKRTADMIADWFRREKMGAVCIHGDRTQEQREDALQDFRTGKVQFLVATDVAARGLDIANVLWVINYDLPNTIDDYIHRIGRTGRCGNTGTALSFINEGSGIIIRHLYDLLKENGQSIPPFLQTMIDNGVAEREQFHRRGDGRQHRDRMRSNAPSAPVFRDKNAKAFEIG